MAPNTLAVRATSSSSAGVTASAPAVNLRRGSSGPAVAQLQAALIGLGFKPGPVDGVFGRVTEGALKAFQKSRKIYVDGIYGPQSRGALRTALAGSSPAPAPAPSGSAPAANLRLGSRGASVKQLQAALAKVGYSPGPIDGIFGRQTQAALTRFQSRYGLIADGTYGPQSRAGLTAALAGKKPPPAPAPSAGEPPANYAKISFRGVRMNVRTQQMILRAEQYARQLGVRTPFPLTQGSYHPGVGASAGTHDGGGTIDFRTLGLTKTQIALQVKALRMAGFAAWSRGNGNDTLSPHIHGVAIGDREMSPSARSQVREYFAGGDGLIGSRPDPDRAIGRPFPAWANRYR